MKKPLVAVFALALAACASADKPASNGATAKAGGATYFCWRDRLAAEGDHLACNWERDVNDACRSFATTPLAKASIASGPTQVRRCDNGQWLVQVTTR